MTRPRTRLEVDDETYCKWCGVKLSDWLLENEVDPLSPADRKVELCGNCRADLVLYGAPKGELSL